VQPASQKAVLQRPSLKDLTQSGPWAETLGEDLAEELVSIVAAPVGFLEKVVRKADDIPTHIRDAEDSRLG